jgi:hypothetical protein
MAIFDFTETSYIEAVWYVAWKNADWCGCVFRDGPDRPWRATHRFRHYKDDKTFDSDDEKSVFRIDPPPAANTRDVLVHAFDTMATAMAVVRGATVHKVRICGGQDRFESVMVKQPWVHRKVVPLPPEPDRPQ